MDFLVLPDAIVFYSLHFVCTFPFMVQVHFACMLFATAMSVVKSVNVPVVEVAKRTN